MQKRVPDSSRLPQTSSGVIHQMTHAAMLDAEARRYARKLQQLPGFDTEAEGLLNALVQPASDLRWVTREKNGLSIHPDTGKILVRDGRFKGEMVRENHFNTDQFWTKGDGWSIADGFASSDGSQGGRSELSQVCLEVQRKYTFSITITDYVAGNVRLRNGVGSGEVYITDKAANGTYTAEGTAVGGTTLVVDADADFVGNIDKVSAKPVDVSLYLDLHDILCPITYTSPSPKVVLHSDGELKYAKHNLVARSENFEDWGVSQNGTGIIPVVSNNSAEAPNGTMTAGTVTLDLDGGTTTGDSSTLAASGITLSAGFTFRLKIWLKGTAGQKVLIRHAGGSSYDIHTFTGGWDEFEGDETAGSTGVKTPLIALRGGFGVDGQGPVTFNIWHPHMFYRPSDETYIKTLDASSGVRYAPAILHDDSGTCLGILGESAATGLLLYSADVQDGTQWIAYNGTSAAEVDSVFGEGYTAYKCTGDGAGSRRLYQDLTLAANTQHVIACILTEDTGTISDFGLYDLTAGAWQGLARWTWADDAVTENIATVDDGGYIDLPDDPSGARRVLAWAAITTHATNTSYRIYSYPNGTLATSAATTVHYMQCEAGSKPSSPIITHGATATRAVDQLSIAVADLPFDQTEGTLYAKVYYPNGSDIVSSSQTTAVFYENGSNRILLYNGSAGNSGKFLVADGTTQASTGPGGGPHAPKTSTKMAASWIEDDFVFRAGGLDATPDTSGTVPDGIDTLYLGAQITASPLQGCLTELVYLPRKVSLANLGVLAP